MADFEVRTDRLNDIAADLNNISNKTRAISNEAKRIMLNLRSSITARIAYSLQRSVVCTNINNCAVDLTNMSNGLRKVSAYYKRCENAVENEELFDENIGWIPDIASIIDFFDFDMTDVVPKPALDDLWKNLFLPWSPMLFSPLILANSGRISSDFANIAKSVAGGYEWLKNPTGGFKDFLAATNTGVTGFAKDGSVMFKGLRDLGSFGGAMATLFKDGKIGGSLAEGSIGTNFKFFGVDGFSKASGDVLGVSATTGGKIGWDAEKGYVGIEGNVGAEAHLASGKLEAGYGLVGLEANGTVGTASAKGSLGATIIKDGKFAPSIGLEGKAEAAVAKGDIGATYGSESNNAHVKAEGTLLGAEAEAGVQAGVITYTEGGVTKKKVGVKAEAGAEAYLAQGEVKGGFTILGIEIDASVEGKIGGAGAGVGGEVTSENISGSLDLGLGAGVGLNVSVDWSGFDASGLVEGVENTVEGIAEGVENTVEGIKDGVDAFTDWLGF